MIVRDGKVDAMRKPGFGRRSALSLWMVGALMMGAGMAVAAEAEDAETGRIEVARLTLAAEEKPVCFSPDFLTTVARETELPVSRRLATVPLSSERIYQHPFVILSGSGELKLSEAERANLKRYLDRGGFVYASASCSNAQWANDFERLMKRLQPEETFEPVEKDDPLRHTLYDIERIDTRRPAETTALHRLKVNGHVAVVFSPVGINDTANAGGGCCCCGGNEVSNARQVNANVLVYALMH